MVVVVDTLVVVVGGGQVSKHGKHRFHYDNCEKIELKSSKKLLGHGTEGYFIHTVRLVYPIDFYLIKKGGPRKRLL